jgi:hypothetical protein
VIGGIDHSLGPGENDPRASEKGRRGSPTSRMTVAVRLLDDHKRMPDVHRVDVIAGLRGLAATDVALRAEVLTYSRSRGLIACAFLDGSTLRPDNDAN